MTIQQYDIFLDNKKIGATVLEKQIHQWVLFLDA